MFFDLVVSESDVNKLEILSISCFAHSVERSRTLTKRPLSVIIVVIISHIFGTFTGENSLVQSYDKVTRKIHYTRSIFLKKKMQ